MIEMYKHQVESVEFLVKRPAAMLASEMGTGKSRCALVAAAQLYEKRKIDRVLILAPAAVRYAWREELTKLGAGGYSCNLLSYDPKQQRFTAEMVIGNLNGPNRLAVSLVSYSMLPQERHVNAIKKWCAAGDTLLVCDESSFLKNRSAKQTRGARLLGASSLYRWLLTGTPIANSPLDLWGQGLVMGVNGCGGPLKGFQSFYHFRNHYAILGGYKVHGRPVQIVGYQNLEGLQKRFAPYVLRREKKDCLDLPDKTYSVREVALEESTWRVYCELKRDALLALGNGDMRPEPNAAVRLLRLCQITSGHVGIRDENYACDEATMREVNHPNRDVSSEKLDWLATEILSGELSNERALIVWCRWRRERERLAKLLKDMIVFHEIYGGQDQNARANAIRGFQASAAHRRVLLAQPHAGGFGLNLTAASTAVYLSNDFSFTTRVQSEDRTHRIGQRNPCTYIDVLAVGPKGQRSVDHHVLDCLRAKKSLADMTCSAWRAALEQE